MDSIISFLNPIFEWLPMAFFGSIIFFAAVLPQNYLKKLAWWSAGFRIFYAAILSLSQYYIWTLDSFTKFFLDYIVSYSWSRFWTDVLFSFALAILFWFFLKALQKKEERFFEAGETELGLVLALALGWPDFVIFVPLAFLAVVLFSLFRQLFMKEAYTTIRWPFVAAAVVTFVLSAKIFAVLPFLSAIK